MLPRSLSIFFSDEVIENLFSNIRGGVERECEGKKYRHFVALILVALRVNNQSVSLDDEDLRKFIEEQKNYNTQNKTLPDLRTW